MIATGADVKPLECLLYMRDVKSRNYFEQMKGRGTRTIDLDALLTLSVSNADKSKLEELLLVVKYKFKIFLINGLLNTW